MSEQSSIRSMTGFARASHSRDGVEVTVELRSVNHRFFDVNIKVPRCYAPYEREVKASLQQLHRRGRIEIFISRTSCQSDGDSADMRISPQFDSSVQAYVAACRRYGASGGGLEGFLAQMILREYGTTEEKLEVTETESAWMLDLVRQASAGLAEMRATEGAGLRSDLRSRLDALTRYRQEILQRGLTLPARLRERMQERLAALAPEVVLDPERLAQEVALLADRVDITEELSRLEIHLSQFSRLLAEGHADGVGRKLDFLTQEIGREINTVGSKAQDAQVQGIVVDAKAELERIREQVQNIE